MPIKSSCMYCGRQYKVAESHAGKTFKCKQCSHPVKVPEPKPEASAPKPKPAVSEKLLGTGKPRVPDEPAAAGAGTLGVSAQPAVTGQTARPYGSDGSFHTNKSTAESFRQLNLAFLFGVGVILVGMVLPWLSLPANVPNEIKKDFGYVSGFQLPFVVNNKLSDMRAKGAERMHKRGLNHEQIENRKEVFDAYSAPFMSLYALLLIPILTLIALADELSGAKVGNNRWYVRLIAALSPLIAFLIIILAFAFAAAQLGSPDPGGSGDDSSPSFFDVIGFGFWVVLIGAMGLFISVFTSPKPTTNEEFGPPPTRTPPGPGRSAPATAIPVKALGKPRLPANAKRPPRH